MKGDAHVDAAAADRRRGKDFIAKLVLADEPTGSLDHASANALGQLLSELNKEEGVTLIVVTHSRDLANMMGRTLELEDGTWKSEATKMKPR